MKNKRIKRAKRCFFCEQPILPGQPVTSNPEGDMILHDVCVIRLIHDYKGRDKLEKN